MKDSLDILLDNVSEDVTEYEPEFVAHDSLNILRSDVICHHGILGMKWGIRRYQNKDGSLTAAGKKRYLKSWDKYLNGKRSKRRDSLDILSDHLTEKEMTDLYKDTFSSYGISDKYAPMRNAIIERLTGEKFDKNKPMHAYMREDLDYADYFVDKKLSEDKRKQLMDETEIAYRNNHAPEGYKLSEWSKDPSKEIIYNKETPKYVLQFEPQQHDDRPSKVHEDFEKNSSKILNQSMDAFYKELKKTYGEDYNLSREEFNKYSDKPVVKIMPENSLAQITTIEPFGNLIPTIEYDMKNKKVLRTSLDG